MNSQRLPLDRRARKMAAAGIVVVSLGLVGGVGAYYFSEREEISKEKSRMLAGIGDLKRSQILQWRKERMADAARAARDELIGSALPEFLAAPDSPESRAKMRGVLKSEVPGYANILLFDPSGNLLLSTEDLHLLAPVTTQDAIRAAMSGEEGAISDFFLSDNGTAHIDVAAAVRDHGGRTLAVLVLRCHASDEFFSILQFWPVESASTETVLAQREGNDVVVVNELRFAPNGSMGRRFPLTRTSLPAVQAALGRDGRFQGKDYRDEEVLADLRAVTGSSWYLVSKLDQEEINTIARYRVGAVGLVIGLIILLVATGVAYFYRSRQTGILKSLIIAERSRADMETTYRMLFESMLNGFALHEIICDAEGRPADYRFLTVNPAFERMTGMKAADVVGRTVKEVLPATEPMWIERYGRVALTGEAVEFEDFSGALARHFKVTAFCPQKGRFAVVFDDITERRKEEEELHILRMAVEQSANTIVITDPGGHIEYVNPCFEKATGYTFAEAVGQNPRVLKSGEQDGSFYRNLWDTILSGQIWKGQFHNRRKDGSLYWEEATISPVFDNSGRIVHFIAVKEDITERKALEANLLDALDRAEAGNRAKSEFLAVMSHELRTPLNGVLGFAELLSESPLNQEQREHARTIRNSGEHLLRVVNDILDFSSIERQRLKLENAPLSIADLVESSCLPVRNAAAHKGLEFRSETKPGVPAQIHGDERRIRQILINLLGNAVKFTSSGSVVLRIAPASCGIRPALDFSVEDTGLGIPSETIPLLFKPFTQADSTLRRPFEGTGLGLAISQRLAEAMGGKITIVSTPGRGSRFTLRLPIEDRSGQPERVEKPPQSVPASSGAGGAPPPGNLVLVVEDDATSRLLAGKMLESLGCGVEFARDGQAAVDAFASGKFSAIFMDMQMPVMDGITATKMIREAERATDSRVPIIALTANVMPGDRERCNTAGMDDFLSKPFTKDVIAACLARHCRP